MIVIADTSPINYLVRSEYVWILHELFGELLIPRAVLIELRHRHAPAEVKDFAEHIPPWIRVVDVSGQVREIDPLLGIGEREAISLALDLGADALLIDDLAGRREALSRGVPARGTLAVLLQAGARGHLDFPAAYKTLVQLGFRTSEGLEKSLFKEYEGNG